MATATASSASGTLGKGALGMFHMPTVNRPDFTQRATNCALLTVSVVCVCVLVVCGVMIVREYALAEGYHASKCQVAKVDYASNEIACMFCGPGPKSAAKEKGSGACKHSRFPCVRIRVTFSIDGEEREGLLHPDSLQAASPYSQCSYTICLKFPDDNRRAVEEYAQSWRDKGTQTFDCFVDAVDNEDVIVFKMHTKEDVVHSMIWPSLIIAVCGIIFLRLEMKRRDIVACPCSATENCNQGENTENGDVSDTAVLNCGQQRPPPYHTWCQETKLAGGGSSGGGGERSCKVECKLLRCSGDDAPAFMSNSLTALDRLMTREGSQQQPQQQSHMMTNPGLVIHNGKIGTSLSAEGLTLPRDVTSNITSQTKPLRPGLQPLDIADSSATVSSSGSPGGSRVKGLETPV